VSVLYTLLKLGHRYTLREREL